VSQLVLVVSDDCRLCDRARAALVRLRVSFREVDIVDDEAGELAARGVPIVFFPVLLDGDRVLAYGEISETELSAMLAPTPGG
jgi:glutaredoxin